LRSNEKHEPESANLKFITASEVVVSYPLSIDVGAIQTSNIANTPPLRTAANLCMSSANSHIVKK